MKPEDCPEDVPETEEFENVLEKESKHRFCKITFYFTLISGTAMFIASSTGSFIMYPVVILVLSTVFVYMYVKSTLIHSKKYKMIAEYQTKKEIDEELRKEAQKELLDEEESLEETASKI